VYEPIRYVLTTGGKRVRSVLTLLACEAAGGKARDALAAATAVEILHNFTLVHDDVMDNAAVRRGMPTVHRRWDTNVAILSGDQMVALAYRLLLSVPAQRRARVLDVFTDAFIQVCEGQGLDKEFESRRGVTIGEYFQMIRKKTGRVISAASEIGGILGGGTAREVRALRTFGEHLGRAFQVQDDLLDIVGSEREFGKAIGGDIVEGKKTFLLLAALGTSHGKDRALLQAVAGKRSSSRATVRKVKSIYQRTGVLDDARMEISRSTNRAQRALGDLRPGKARDTLLWLSGRLLERHA